VGLYNRDLMFAGPIKILHGIEGARRASGIAVIIDVFRFSNTVLSLLDSGIEELIPVADLEEAHEFRRKHPDILLIGERGGKKPPSFDFDNSPYEISRGEFQGKRAVITTSAGSRGLVEAARKADQVLVASFGNARAVADYLRKRGETPVTLVPLGLNGEIEAEEDTLCALYIAGLLFNFEMDYETIRKELLSSPGAQRLRSLGREKDLEICTELDRFETVPTLCKTENGFIIQAMEPPPTMPSG